MEIVSMVLGFFNAIFSFLFTDVLGGVLGVFAV